MEALIYTRVSQDRAHGRSVAEQEADARLVCEREGWHVAEVVTDTVGASRLSKGTRSGWQEVVAKLDAGEVDVLVTWEASRAQRDIKAYAELRDICAATGTLWSYQGRIYDLTEGTDRFATGLDALLAEREAEDIRKRVLRAVRNNAAAGRPHGRRLFGYRRVYDPDTGRLIGQEPEPEEAEVVRGIFADFLAGTGYRTIARNLNAVGIATSTGAQWADSQVKRVLANPAYVARRVHQGEVIGDATWPALVSDDTFDRAQARIDHRGRHVKRGAKPTARLLSGVARCGICGGRMGVGHDRKNRKVYQCRRFFHVSRDEHMLDTYVSDLLIARIETLDLTSTSTVDPEAERARRDIADYRGRLDEAVEMFKAGDLTGATLARIESDLLASIDEAEQRLRRVVIPLDFTVPETDVAQWWEGLPRPLRREIVGALIASVVVNPTRTGVRTFDPAAIEVDWR